MVEKLQTDASTPLPLEQHLQQVETALAAAMDNPGAASSGGAGLGGGEDAFTDALITTPVSGAASMFVAVADQLNGHKNPLSGSKNDAKKSNFLGHGYVGQRATPTPLIPMTYAEKKTAAKRANRAAAKAPKGGVASAHKGASVFASERLALTSMSLTGSSMTDKKRKPMKGAKVDVAMAMAMGLTGLVQELNNTLRTMQGNNRYDGNSGSKRLEKDLETGKTSAMTFVQDNPVMAAKALNPT